MKSKNKVLLVGLGILGGGLSTALWLLKHGFDLTITDTKSKKDLAPSLKKLKKYLPRIQLILGEHRLKDILNNDLIILNQAVPVLHNPLVKFAQKHQKPIKKELELFLDQINQPVIGITGTRGKTTTTLWIHHLLRAKYQNIQVGGNNPDYPLFSFIDKLKQNIPVVLEIPCFQLELPLHKAPHIAIITNLYTDHLNRYRTLKQYAQIKANIFKYQTKNDYLILNNDNSWTKYFLSLKPKAQVYFTSLKKLPKNLNGVYFHKNWIFYQKDGHPEKITNVKIFNQLWGLHNTDNLLRAILVAKILKLSNAQIKKQLASLPQVKMRQEIVFQDKTLTIINDSAGTSPEAGVAALNRWDHNKNFILITGGTDKALDFKQLAKEIKKKLAAPNLILLNGSATKKLIEELEKLHYSKTYNVFENLGECLTYSFFLAQNKKKAIIAFSPASASFEKFKNEFDRGEKFNHLVKQLVTR
jgi:UDP-N-acetylmuramoylalanine--D-glutamate ligase